MNRDIHVPEEATNDAHSVSSSIAVVEDTIDRAARDSRGSGHLSSEIHFFLLRHPRTLRRGHVVLRPTPTCLSVISFSLYTLGQQQQIYFAILFRLNVKFCKTNATCDLQHQSIFTDKHYVLSLKLESNVQIINYYYSVLVTILILQYISTNVKCDI